MKELEKFILVATDGHVEVEQLSDNKNDNTILLNEICDKMRNGGAAALGFKQYDPCFLFHLVGDIHNKFPELVDLRAIHDHIQQYEEWATEESGKGVQEFA